MSAFACLLALLGCLLAPVLARLLASFLLASFLLAQMLVFLVQMFVCLAQSVFLLMCIQCFA